MAAEVKRGTRVAEGIREELAKLLGRRVRDPRVAGAIVTRVVLTDDLRSAKVYVRLLDGDDSRKRHLLYGMDAARGLLRRSIAGSLNLRVTPELRFEYDSLLEEHSRIDEILQEIQSEPRR